MVETNDSSHTEKSLAKNQKRKHDNLKEKKGKKHEKTFHRKICSSSFATRKTKKKKKKAKNKKRKTKEKKEAEEFQQEKAN